MAGYELIKKGRGGKKGSGTENLDFDYKILVFKQIDRINIARTNNDSMMFFNGVDGLADFLEPYAVDSDRYQKTVIEIFARFDKEIKEIKGNNAKGREVNMNRYRRLFRALMLLIHENDLLPEQSGVYSDKDG